MRAGQKVTRHALIYTHYRPKLQQTFLCVEPEWRDLKSSLCSYECVFTSDWSSFDSSVPASLLRDAWNVMLFGFSDEDRRSRVYATNATNFFYANFINTTYSMQPLDIRAVHGIPSSGILTSIIGSIVKYSVLTDLFQQNTLVSDFKVLVYGNDALVGFNAKKCYMIGALGVGF